VGFSAVHNLICGSFQTRSGFWLCGDQSRSHGRNRAKSSLLRDNSCYLSLVRLDRYLYQVMSIEVEVLACLPRYSISSPHSIPTE